MTSFLVPPPLVLASHGTSLSNGRLATGWVARLAEIARGQAECKGPLRVYDMGHGGWTSADLLADVANVIARNPTHILTEGGAINDCVDFGGGPAISRATHLQNNADRYAAIWAANPACKITVHTMSPVSATGAAIRPTLADYYADEVAQAVTLAGAGKPIDYIDHYAGWPKPLADNLSNGYLPLVYAPPAGFAVWDAAASLNPADKNAHAILLANNYGMVSDFATQCAVRATSGKNAGKFYFEVTVDVLENVCAGIMTAAGSLANGSRVGADVNGHGYNAADGYYWNNGQTINNLGAVASGGVINVAVDLTAGKIWFGRNNTYPSGAPAAGTGGFAVAAGTWYPALSGGLGGQLRLAMGNMPGDGLHPVRVGGVDTYLEPAVLAWLKTKMAAFWP